MRVSDRLHTIALLALTMMPAAVTAQEPGIRYDQPSTQGGFTIQLDPPAAAPLRSGERPVRRLEQPVSTPAQRLSETTRRHTPAAPGVIEALDGRALSIGCFPAPACDDLYRRRP